MSFLKCSISATEKLHTSSFITTRIKGQTMIPNKQNFEHKALKVGFVLQCNWLNQLCLKGLYLDHYCLLLISMTFHSV